MKAVTRGITLLVSDGAEMLVDVAAVADRSYSDVILRLIELEAQSTT
jgi:predicted CopG family antitoxin